MTEYTADSIKVLEEIEHIQTTPGLYVGDTSDPTHLLYEGLDNALDEAQEGHASLVGVEIDTKLHIITIADNGRGIPIENDTILKVASKLFSGGKFDKGQKGVYKIASGIHGIGIVAITALSETLQIDVYRNDKHASYKFKNAKLDTKNIENYIEPPPFSTQLTFKPSKKFFESLVINIDQVKERLKIASVHIPKLSLLLVVDGKEEIISCNLDQFFNTEVLGCDPAKSNITKIIDVNTKLKDEQLHIRFCWDLGGTVTPKHLGCVNLLSVTQGTHIARTFDMIRNILFEYASKEKLKISKQDCLLGFRAFTSIMLYSPAYTSQTKERLSIPRDQLNPLYSKIEKKIRELFKNDSSLMAELFNYFESYRRKMDSSKKIIKTGRTVTRINTVIDSTLRDCTTHNVDRSILFITEGASASGSLLQCRDPKYHAILSLKGKIPNLADDKKHFLKNKEIIEIINALGTGVEPDFSLDGIRYGKIIYLCDADEDGKHIQVLLMTLFLKLVPQLIDKGYVHLAIMPLYGAMVKKNFIPIYSEEDLTIFKENNPSIKTQRYKGLGEMNPDQLYACILDPANRRTVQVMSPIDKKNIFNLMTDSELKRKLV